MSISKETDILVLGATGFTGRLVVRYLSNHPEFISGGFTFAIGARSKSRLDDVAEGLQLPESKARRVIVDVLDPQSLMKAVAGVKVVINAVGPYFKWGTPVVEACVKSGTHHVDITGERWWVYQIIQKFDYLATKTGAIIIPGCGYDSIPSDFSAYLSVKALKAALGPTATAGASISTHAFVGSMSGGTFATLISTFEDVPRELRRTASRNYSLSPAIGRHTPPIRLSYAIPALKKIGSFFVMAPINRGVVQRTWGLKQLESVPTRASSSSSSTSYGPNFTYDECLNATSKLMATITSLATVAAFILIAVTPIWILKMLGPKSGDGPSEEVMQNGFIKVTNVTASDPSSSSSKGREVIYGKTVIEGRGDPGYLLTSVMIAESALCLLHPSSLPPLARQGGILTPVTGLGDALVERLEKTGRFKFTSEILREAGDRKTQ